MIQTQSVQVHHEWGELREVIVGKQTPGIFIIPPYYEGMGWMEGRMLEPSQQHGGRRLLEVDPEFDRALTEQIDALAKLLEQRGVKVHRPEPLDAHTIAACPGGFYSGIQVFPRDPVLVVGRWMIEVNLRMRTRRLERFGLQPTLKGVHTQGRGAWVSMPPRGPALRMRMRRACSSRAETRC